MFRGEYNDRCRRFSGYKPCEPGKICNGCEIEDGFDETILLINLDAMGDVLMTTCLLPSLRRRYPRSLLTWLTLPGHAPLLDHNPLIDRVWTFDAGTISVLEAMEFEILLNADRGRPSCALAMRLRAAEKRGFGMTKAGMITYLNPKSAHLYRLGLDDREKFQVNRRTGQDLLAEAFELPYERDPYILALTAGEIALTRDYRSRACGSRPTIGIQTGCSDLYPLKSLTEEQVVDLVRRLRAARPEAAILLLGGPSETERIATIAERCDDDLVVPTPTGEGLRRGILYVNACDVVVSPDTGALHIALALGKQAVGWFNVSCAQEIDMFDRGVKVTTPLHCSPCWRRSCPAPICLPMADLSAIVEGVAARIPR